MTESESHQRIFKALDKIQEDISTISGDIKVLNTSVGVIDKRGTSASTKKWTDLDRRLVAQETVQLEVRAKVGRMGKILSGGGILSAAAGVIFAYFKIQN